MTDERIRETTKENAVIQALHNYSLNPYPVDTLKIPKATLDNVLKLAIRISNESAFLFLEAEIKECILEHGYTDEEVYAYKKPETGYGEGVKVEEIDTKTMEPVEPIPESPAETQKPEVPEELKTEEPEEVVEESVEPPDEFAGIPIDLGNLKYASVVEMLLLNIGRQIGKTIADSMKEYNASVDAKDIIIKAEPDLANRKAKFIMEVIVNF